MKKIFFICLTTLFIFNIDAQVFNTGKTLKKGTFLVGVNPVFQGNDLGLYLHGGYGLMKGLDLGVRLGMGLGGSYIGADLEYALLSEKLAVSLTAGGHMHGDVGFDGTLNITIPLAKSTRIFSGLDGDINFGGDVEIPVWIPVGLEVGIRKSIAILIEGDIGITSVAGSIFGGGLTFYF